MTFTGFKVTILFHHFRAHLDILKSNGVGMDDPLVDSEDFPRNDIDVYQVNMGSL